MIYENIKLNESMTIKLNVYYKIEQDACRGVHSACRREVNQHKLDICVLYGLGRGGSRNFRM